LNVWPCRTRLFIGRLKATMVFLYPWDKSRDRPRSDRC
jgi:hypothetical protein